MAKALHAGDTIPGLKGMPVNKDEEFDLQDAIKDKPVVIVFSRYFCCPVCQSDFDKLLEVKEKIMSKAGLVYITQSETDSAKTFLEDKDKADFPVICDPNAPYPLYQQWNVGNMNLLTLGKVLKTAVGSKYKHGKKEGNEKHSPADFIVGMDGKLLHANYSLLDTKKLLDVLNSL
jgi:peroxiredoxin